MEAGGIVDCTGSEAEILTRYQLTSRRTSPLCIEAMTGNILNTTALYCARCNQVACFSCISIYLDRWGPRKCPFYNLEFLNVKEEWAMAQLKPKIYDDSWGNVVDHENGDDWGEAQAMRRRE